MTISGQTLAKLRQDQVLDALIELYVIDLTPIGESEVFYLTPTPNGAASITYNGNAYLPFPIQGEGFEVSTDGSPPQPTLRVSNVTRYLQSYLTLYQDLVGAKVTRQLVFQSQLAEPEDVGFSKQTFLIHQLSSQTKDMLEWKLVSVLDNKQRKLPRRQVLRDEFPGAGLFRAD